ncbi:YciK family oxidoreductase [Aestuariibacter salexigens]|uniref:YciK family oxidoreductase n=1 Tax=Aestuariibacter salexigens TaxID=226010 RepID=UPI000428DE06|nr:YciK family oxidoreductase [Aestuariibacter salexigens]
MHDYSPTPDYLKNRVILVTGAGDGIGRQAALEYAAYGATVILLGRTVKKLEAVYDEIVAANGPEPAIVPMDLKGATVKHYQDMAVTIEQQFGALHGILHNASLLGHLSPFKEIQENEYNDIMRVNVHADFFMTQALLPVLLKADNASVIFTSSGVGSKGRAFWGSYAISKFATEGMMQVIADEYDNSTLRFNCINPGKTRTAMRASAYPAEDPLTLRTPEEIMGVYHYLMSDDSVNVTGQTLKAQPDK